MARAEKRYALTALEEAVGGRRRAQTVSVREFSHAATAWASSYYRKRGVQTRYASEVRQVTERLAEIYGDWPVGSLDHVCLKAVRESWAQDGCSRTGVNHYAKTLRLALKWGVEEGLVPAAVLALAQVIRPLARGRTNLRENPRRTPVADWVVEATLPNLAPVYVAIIRLMRLTAMRPCEACDLRPSRLRTSGEVWVLEIPDWKCSHIDSLPPREVVLGPRARAVIEPWLAGVRRWESPLFVTPSRRRAITPITLWKNVRAACVMGSVPTWTPYQLRHTRMTEVRNSHGIEAAQAVGGHAHISMTEHYAAKNMALATTAALASG